MLATRRLPWSSYKTTLAASRALPAPQLEAWSLAIPLSRSAIPEGEEVRARGAPCQNRLRGRRGLRSQPYHRTVPSNPSPHPPLLPPTPPAFLPLPSPRSSPPPLFSDPSGTLACHELPRLPGGISGDRDEVLDGILALLDVPHTAERTQQPLPEQPPPTGGCAVVQGCDERPGRAALHVLKDLHRERKRPGDDRRHPRGSRLPGEVNLDGSKELRDPTSIVTIPLGETTLAKKQG